MGREDVLDRTLSRELSVESEPDGYDPYNSNGPRRLKKQQEGPKVVHDFEDSQYLRNFWGMKV